jgi:hypothetical protein
VLEAQPFDERDALGDRSEGVALTEDADEVGQGPRPVTVEPETVRVGGGEREALAGARQRVEEVARGFGEQRVRDPAGRRAPGRCLPSWPRPAPFTGW